MIDMLEFRLENLSDPAALQGEALTWGMEIKHLFSVKLVLKTYCEDDVVLS